MSGVIVGVIALAVFVFVVVSVLTVVVLFRLHYLDDNYDGPTDPRSTFWDGHK